MEKTHKVEYIVTGGELGDISVKAELTQKELGKLLLQDGITLVSVNAQKAAYCKPRTRKEKK